MLYHCIVISLLMEDKRYLQLCDTVLKHGPSTAEKKREKKQKVITSIRPALPTSLFPARLWRSHILELRCESSAGAVRSVKPLSLSHTDLPSVFINRQQQLTLSHFPASAKEAGGCIQTRAASFGVCQLRPLASTLSSVCVHTCCVAHCITSACSPGWFGFSWVPAETWCLLSWNYQLPILPEKAVLHLKRSL